MYYIITSAVYNATDVTDTNITITGLSPTINYTVTIIPVNIIGYGPPVNINGTVTITLTIVMSFIVSISIPNIMMTSAITTYEYISITVHDSSLTPSMISIIQSVTTTYMYATTKTVSSCVYSKLLLLIEYNEYIVH